MFRFAIIVLTLFFGDMSAFAQGLTRVMSGYSAISGPHAVLWIGRDAGLFEKNGLRADVAYIRSGSTHAHALVAGELQMGQMGGPAALAAGVVRSFQKDVKNQLTGWSKKSQVRGAREIVNWHMADSLWHIDGTKEP